MGYNTLVELHQGNNTRLQFLFIEYMKLLMYVRIYILILTRRIDPYSNITYLQTRTYNVTVDDRGRGTQYIASEPSLITYITDLPQEKVLDFSKKTPFLN